MKCPKCNYISFDDAERCRNCGYDFAFAEAALDPAVELPLRDRDLPEGADDLPLTMPTPAPQDLASDEWRDHEPGAGRGRVPGGVARHSAADLPLFDEPVAGMDDTPLITSPSRPRAPLAVRRSTIEPGRPSAREDSDERRRGRPAYGRDDADDLRRDTHGATAPAPGASRSAEPVSARRAKELQESPPGSEGRAHRPSAPAAPRSPSAPGRAGADPTTDPEASLGAPVGRRFLAMLIDAAIILGIDAAVVWFTLQVVGLPPGRVRVLPIAPMLLFFALLNGGYLVGFTTASGQTIGKMLTGVRVVGETTSRVPLGSAVVRAAATLLTIASLGIGYVPALSGGERRTLHDRLARTRVVRK